MPRYVVIGKSVASITAATITEVIADSVEEAFRRAKEGEGTTKIIEEWSRKEMEYKLVSEHSTDCFIDTCY